MQHIFRYSTCCKFGKQLTQIYRTSSSQNFLTRALSSSTEKIDILVPALGDSINEGTLVDWLKSTEDVCLVDEIIAVIETDKVSVDVRAPAAGTIEDILVQVDENVSVGDLICRLDAHAVEEVALVEGENPGQTTEAEKVKESDDIENMSGAAS